MKSKRRLSKKEIKINGSIVRVPCVEKYIELTPEEEYQNHLDGLAGKIWTWEYGGVCYFWSSDMYLYASKIKTPPPEYYEALAEIKKEAITGYSWLFLLILSFGIIIFQSFD